MFLIELIFKVIAGLIFAAVDGLFIHLLSPWEISYWDSFLVSFLFVGLVTSALTLHEITNDM